MIDDIVCFKLITGEEIIGTKVPYDSNSIKDVAAIMMVPNQGTGQVNIGLMPFLPYSDDESYTFKEEAILVRFKPNTDLINNYNRIFGAGIQIASKIQ